MLRLLKHSDLTKESDLLYTSHEEKIMSIIFKIESLLVLLLSISFNGLAAAKIDDSKNLAP